MREKDDVFVLWETLMQHRKFGINSIKSLLGAGALFAGLALIISFGPSCGSGTSSTLAFFAGNLGGSGNADGTGAAARFRGPVGMSMDSAGNVYVADIFNNRIRKITPLGEVTTLAGARSGMADGTGAAASFRLPHGVTVDSSGNVYVADRSNHTIRKITSLGVVTTLAGTAGMSGSDDQTGAAARFFLPTGVVVDSAGNIYVADQFNQSIRKVTSAGVVTTLAGNPGFSGNADGAGAAARFNQPSGITIGSDGDLYVADSSNHTIRKIVISTGAVTTLAGSAGVAGSIDNITGANARFNLPYGLTADGSGNLYVTDSLNRTIRKVTLAGVVTTLAGTPGTVGVIDGIGAAALFDTPYGITTDPTGSNIYVADIESSTIRKITPVGVVTTFAGSPGLSGTTDGAADIARFSSPQGSIATDIAGNIYFADTYNHTIRKITPAGVVSTLAGTGDPNGNGGSADGTGTSASFSQPYAVATDSAANVYVADYGNHTIRKITPLGVVTTLAGTAGTSGVDDGIGAAARFDRPQGIATDASGNVYVADYGNHTIRKITPAGLVSTLAGTAGTTGTTDGNGAAALFNTPYGIATDSVGNVYVADARNNTIRKITPAGVVTTLAGTAGAAGTADGTGAAARFDSPIAIVVDSLGIIYVGDGSRTIRKITPAGVVTTIVGVPGISSFVPGALPGIIASPYGLAIIGTSLYMAFLQGVAVVLNRP